MTHRVASRSGKEKAEPWNDFWLRFLTYRDVIKRSDGNEELEFRGVELRSSNNPILMEKRIHVCYFCTAKRRFYSENFNLFDSKFFLFPAYTIQVDLRV